MIINSGKLLEFQNQTPSAPLSLEWYVSSTHNIIDINTKNLVRVTPKK